MTKSTQLLLYGLLLVIALATGYWFYNNFTWVVEEKDVGFQGIAKSNQLLAAEFFLRKMGIPVRQVNGLVAFRDLPSAQKTLLIATPRKTLNQELSQGLLDWVQSGGHLIVEARLPKSETGKDKKGTKTQPSQEDSLLRELSVFVSRSKADNDNKDIPIELTLGAEGQGQEIQVNFPYSRILSRSGADNEQLNEAALQQPVWLVQDELGAYLMQFSLGQGLLTVLTSSTIFTNDQLGHHDHARLLHYLVQQQGHDDGVWLIRVDDMPALWTWLWDNAWYTMLCLSILLLLWLWRAPLRFGPVMNDAQTQRRSLLEHIQASGYYRWHENQSSLLLSKVQENLWETIQSSHPVVRRENPAQAYAMLEEITSIKASLIKQALKPVLKLTEHEFTEQVRLLETIRKHL